jgi:hypothetical protein
MLIATFGPTTGWAGKSISFEHGRFSLEGHGQISAANVLNYDSQGHLIWANDDLRELVQQTLPPAPPAPPPVVTPRPTTEVREKVPPLPVTPPADSHTPQTVSPPLTTNIWKQGHEDMRPPIMDDRPKSKPPKQPATVADVFKRGTEFAERIISTTWMEAVPRWSGYVNLNSSAGTMAQIHPQADGIGLVLRCRGDHLPATLLTELPVASLKGYKGANARWLDGRTHPYENKGGPAIAFLIPDEVEDLGDDAQEWQDIVRFLEYAETL